MSQVSLFLFRKIDQFTVDDGFDIAFILLHAFFIVSDESFQVAGSGE
jgi:hypothetical protein